MNQTSTASQRQCSSTTQTFVHEALDEIIQRFPLSIQDALYAKFYAEYDSPMTLDLEMVLHKRLTDQEVRHLMFRPHENQFHHYVTLLALPSHSTSEISEVASIHQTLQKRFLTLVYLKHARNWSFVVEFIALNGLQLLVELFLHDDLQVRGQAIDTFIQITSHPSFDWFEKPLGYQAKMLHSKMIALAVSGELLQRIVWNIRMYDPAITTHDQTKYHVPVQQAMRLPGGTFMLLQLMAFFLSWVRKFYTQSPFHELRLSRELLELLREWKQRTQCHENVEPAAAKEELDLAQKLYDDFNRWPAIEDDIKDGVDRQENPDPEQSKAYISSPTPSAASTNAMKEKYFSKELMETLLQDETNMEKSINQAITLCTDTIAAKINVTEARLMRAKAHAQLIINKMSQQHSDMKSTNASVHRHLQNCLKDCQWLLEVDPFHVGAWKCQLTVLSVMNMWKDADEVLGKWMITHGGMLEQKLLSEELLFFKERHEFVREEHRKQQEAEAKKRQESVIKEAKQAEIYQALLQRHKSGSEPVKVDENTALRQPTEQRRTSKSSEVPKDTRINRTEVISSTTIKKTVNSTGKKQHQRLPQQTITMKDDALKSITRGHSFVRKFSQSKADLVKLRDLLLHTPLSTISSALKSSLAEENFPLVLDALELAMTTVENNSMQWEKVGHIVDLISQLPRFQLFLNMMDDVTRETMTAKLLLLSKQLPHINTITISSGVVAKEDEGDEAVSTVCA